MNESQSGSPVRNGIRFTCDGAVAVIELARDEKRNAIDEAMLNELLERFRFLRDANGVSVVVIRGEGRAFCSGIDLKSSLAVLPDASAFGGYQLIQREHELVRQLWSLPQITIAAIQGDAVGGGGFGMAMACDLRYATERARFWMVAAQFNEVQEFGLTWLLQRVAGDGRTLEWLLTGERITANEALSNGMVQAVVEDADTLDSLVNDRIERISMIAPAVVRLMKSSLRHGASQGLESQLEVEAITAALCFQTPEFRAAISSFGKRDPRG